jgi:hypothetical protein
VREVANTNQNIRRGTAVSAGPVAVRVCSEGVKNILRFGRTGGRAQAPVAGVLHTAELRKNPKGISSISPALTDEIGQRWGVSP